MRILPTGLFGGELFNGELFNGGLFGGELFDGELFDGEPFNRELSEEELSEEELAASSLTGLVARAAFFVFSLLSPCSRFFAFAGAVAAAGKGGGTDEGLTVCGSGEGRFEDGGASARDGLDSTESGGGRVEGFDAGFDSGIGAEVGPSSEGSRGGSGRGRIDVGLPAGGRSLSALAARSRATLGGLSRGPEGGIDGVRSRFASSAGLSWPVVAGGGILLEGCAAFARASSSLVGGNREESGASGRPEPLIGESDSGPVSFGSVVSSSANV